MTQGDLNAPRVVNVVTTGGTIEKSYDEGDGTLANRASIIKERLISQLRLPYVQLNFHPLFAKDSLELTDEDRRLICQFTQTLLDLGRPVVIFHGTDTMHLSMAYLEGHLTRMNAPVVFTGAMKPIGFELSDAVQNATEAIYAAQTVEPGVYLSFHGRLYRGPGVLKNRQKATFEARGGQ